jgi:hypothetical protein
VTVTWTIADKCYTTSTYSATFTIEKPADVVVTKAVDGGAKACDLADQAAAQTAFNTWLATAGVSGGCSPTSTPSTTTAPDYCGGSVTVTWTISDKCYAGDSYSATFTIESAPAIEVTAATTKDPICADATASVKATVTGGCAGANYTYVWANAKTPNTVYLSTTEATVNLPVTENEENWIVTVNTGCTSDSYTIPLMKICQKGFLGGVYPTQTTCETYKTGAPTLAQADVTVSAGKIVNATPGVFFYFMSFEVPAGSFTLKVEQTSGCTGLYDVVSSGSGFDVKVFDGICTRVMPASVTVNQSAGTVDIGFNALPAAQGQTYVLAVKYDTKSIQGDAYVPGCSHSFVTYLNSDVQLTSQANLPINLKSIKSGDLTSDIQSAIPAQVSVQSSLRAYPNPASGPVTFEFTIGVSAKAQLDIYSASGQLVATIFNAYAEANVPEKVTYNSSLPTGTYLYILKWNDQKITGKFIIKH